MMVHLGLISSDQLTFDFGTGYALPDTGGGQIPAESEQKANLCATDTTLWRTVNINGKCFSVCSADPSQSFEVDPGQCSKPPGQTPLDKIPAWAIAAGAGLLVVLIAS